MTYQSVKTILTTMDTKQQASENIAERLNWHTAKKDQKMVAKKLATEQEVDEIYVLEDAGLFDNFFFFLEEFGIMEIIEQLAPKHRERKSGCANLKMTIKEVLC